MLKAKKIKHLFGLTAFNKQWCQHTEIYIYIYIFVTVYIFIFIEQLLQKFYKIL